ncbi:MAG TPA: TolC family protein, partial [Burkholderiales bacterium]|nr:TolC family protein [Burkholderiales bacterium]
MSCYSYAPRPIAPATDAATLESRRLDDADLRQFVAGAGSTLAEVWPPTSWDLNTLTLAALFFHPDLEVSRAQLETARAAILTARARPNPTVSLGAQRSTDRNGEQSPWKLDAGVDLLIETLGKRGIRTKRARELAQSSRLDIVTTAWQIRARVRASLVDLLSADRATTLLERQQSLQREIVSMLELRLRVGEAGHLDLTQFRIAVTQSELSLHEERSKREQARASLAAAIGVPVAALDSIRISPSLLGERSSIADLTELRRLALTERSDIRALLARYAAAESALRLETARQYPDLHLAPGYSWDQGISKWSIGLSAPLPILDQNRGPIAEAEARRKETAARFTALQANVIADLDRGMAAYSSALETMEAADRLLHLQEH